MSAQDDWVKENLEMLRNLQLEDMDIDDFLIWQNKISDMSKRYDDARARENDAKLSAEERKRAKDVADAIAKAAPAITKSVISAINAFKSGDAIDGFAEIMDICAALAPLISTFLDAAGPEGALIGALFSVVGQILRAFGPKQESDVSKLEKFLNELKAQSELEDIKAVHDVVLSYAQTLVLQSQSLHVLLAKPLQTHADYKMFTRELGQANIVLSDTNPHASVGMFTHWKVLEYLKDPVNQDVALWPTVLGICCKTYSDMVTSTMSITAMASTDDMQARLNDVDPGSPGNVIPPGATPLSAEDKRDLERSLLMIQAYAGARKLEYEACNDRMLPALELLVGVAQSWGFYGCVARNHALKLTSGPKRVKTGDWNDVSDRNYYHKLALLPDAATTIRSGQPSSQFNFKPEYHCLVLKSTSGDYPGSSHWVDHLWVHADTLAVAGYSQVLDNFEPAFTDVWAAGETDEGLDVVAGTADVAGQPGSVMAWGLSSKDSYQTASLERVDWWPQTTSAVGTIRAVPAPTALLDDPDQAGIPIGGTGQVLYASMRDSVDIYVNTGNQGYYFSGPAGWGPCTGIAVDDTYLWLYQPYGFAVVSHASVLSHLQSAQTPVRWICYPSLGPALLGENLSWGDHNCELTYNGLPVDTKPPLLGLISLSPCEDGTLLAAVVHRFIEPGPGPRRFDITDTWTIQTARYDVDVKSGTVKVGSWTKIPGDALQVQKLPIPGWSLISSLRAKLKGPKV